MIYGIGCADDVDYFVDKIIGFANIFVGKAYFRFVYIVM